MTHGRNTAPRALPRIMRPMQEFLRTEASGGILLVAAAVAALVWANAPGNNYVDFWHTATTIDVDVFDLHLTLHEWVNDALMAVFFFVVGLEIKREILKGELADPRKAALPVAAALGGMVVPAAIYAALNIGGAGERGWGIPMATDIAFAVGVLSLFGSRVPLSLKVFLLALAIADDLGAILVIAVFYTDDLALGWLGIAATALGATALTGRAGVRDVTVYATLAVVAWLGVHESGVHATIAGVALGLLTPIEPHYVPAALQSAATDLIDDVRSGTERGTREGLETANAALRDLEELARESQSPLDRLEHALHPWTSYLVVPLFALANAGIEIDSRTMSDAATSSVAIGVALGLVLGKPAGILLASALAVRLGIARLPDGVGWAQLAGVAMIAGIGFTVSLFIGALAFSDPALADEAKIGIFAGSLVAAGAGIVMLTLSARGQRRSSAE